MTHKWEQIQLKHILQIIDRSQKVEKDEKYKLLGVRLDSGGAFLRETKFGKDISATRLTQVKTGDFMYSRLFGWRGAFSKIGQTLDGCFVSNEFPIFKVIQNRLEMDFLLYWLQFRPTLEELESLCEGSTPTTRNRLKETAFLGLEMPLPPLEEQQHIVAQLNAVQTQLEQAQELQKQNETDLNLMLRAQHQRISEGVSMERLRDVAPLVRRTVEIDQNESYREVGARSFGKGLFFKPDFVGASMTWERPVWLEENDLVFSNIKAWEGAIAVVDTEHHRTIASHRYVTCVPDTSRVVSQFLKWYFLSPTGLAQISIASPGSADRNRTLNLKVLENIEVPVPPLWQQQQFAKLCNQHKILEQQHGLMELELDAVMPAMIERVFSNAI